MPQALKDLLCAGDGPRPRQASIEVPGDKSISHRDLLLAAFTDGPTDILNLNRGSAVRELFEPLTLLGARFEELDGRLRVLGIEAGRARASPLLDVGPSSAAARLLIGVLAGLEIEATVDGDSTLRRRPMEWLVDPLRKLGAKIDYQRRPGCLPLTLRGGKLRPESRVELHIGSAQARAGVLLAAVHAQTPVEIRHPVLSRDHSERLLGHAGARIEVEDGRVRYLGGALEPQETLTVPGDPSLAAYPVAAALLAGKGARVEVRNVCLNPTRTGFFDVLKRAGARIQFTSMRDLHGEPVGTVVAEGGLEGVAPLRVQDPFTFHGMIDEVPLLCAVATQVPGRSQVHGAHELSFKETNRLLTTRDMLRSFGAKAEATEDALTIEGGHSLQPGPVPGFGDHRIAMAAATLASALQGTSRVLGGACAATSFDGFVEVMQTCGCDLELVAPKAALDRAV